MRYTRFFIGFCIVMFATGGWLMADNGNQVSDPKNEVRDVIHQWKNARQSADPNRYIRLYHLPTDADKIRHEAWVEEITSLFQEHIDITINLSEPNIRFDHNRAKAIFLQQLDDQRLSIHGEKNLILEKRNHHWLITAENWSYVTAVVRIRDASLNPEALLKRIAVKYIEYHYKENQPERISIGFDRYCEPEILPIEGPKPRIAIDIADVLISDEHRTLLINGHLVQRIRTHYHRDSNVLRIVLDLNPKEDVDVSPAFFKAENKYTLTLERQKEDVSQKPRKMH